MTHIPPFDSVRRLVEISTSKGELRVSTSYDAFVGIIKQYVALLPVDEAWYLATYPDVSRAIAEGMIGSAQEHFAQNGYFEGRLPSAPQIDEDWYLDHHPDVAAGVAAGRIKSAIHHFVHDGYKEGRRPRP